MSRPLISVIMSMRNVQDTLALALRSLSLQSVSDWELVLIDDGSVDRSVEIARGFREPRIRLLVDGRQLGLAARLNQAVALAHGKYIARMDADDICYPERFSRQLEYLEVRPEVDLVGSGAMVFHGDGIPIGLYPVRATHEEICSNPANSFYLAHPTWMGKREWFQRFGYRVEATRAQDQDLLLRAYRRSTFAAIPEILLGYRQENVSVANIVRGRYRFAKALWREGLHYRDYGLIAKGLYTQAIRGALTVMVAQAGGEHYLLKRRFCGATETDAASWFRVWQMVNDPMLDARQVEQA